MPSAQRTRIASLDCIIVDGGPAPTVPVVICHGYGASYEDLAPLSGEWINLLGDKASHFRFVFPDAPNSLAELGMPQGRAWWPINMARLAEAMQTSQFEELHDAIPPGIDEARQQLCETIKSVKDGLGGSDVPLALGGFSQGAMLTMDVALRGDIPAPQLLLQFSGTIVCRAQWSQSFPRLANAEVFQSHGTEDPILPFSSAATLSKMLEESGTNIHFHSFVGPHTIDVESIAKTAQALARIAE
ncbi:MAG: alpha/beta hydrolase [Rubripirellula sp.]